MLFIALIYIIFHCLFFTPIVVNALADDDALVAFLLNGSSNKFDQFCTHQGVTNVQSKEILAQIYGIHLGILYYLTQQNWHCAKINNDKIERNDQLKCDHFRKALTILYSYLFGIYVAEDGGNNVMNPNFNDFDDALSLVDVIKRLFWNWKFYFRPALLKENEEKKNFYVAFDAVIVGGAIRSSKKSNLDKRKQSFDDLMKNQLKSVTERYETMAKNGIQDNDNSSSEKNVALFLDTILDMTQIYQMDDAVHDEELLGFMKTDELKNIDESEPHYYEKYALGVLYLLKNHWNCNQGQINAYFDRTQCDKLKRYLDILYEYLFRVHYEFVTGKARRPMFQIGAQHAPLDYVPSQLHAISDFYFCEAKNCKNKFSDPNRWTNLNSLKLLNELELDYLMKDITPSEQPLSNNDRTPSSGRKTALRGQEFGQKLQKLAKLRQEFDQKLMAFAKKEWLNWIV